MKAARVVAVTLLGAGWLAIASLAAAQTQAPTGELSLDGVGPFEGTLGSYCITAGGISSCGDSPWLTPKIGREAKPGQAIVFRLGDGRPITSWEVVYGSAAEFQPDEIELSGTESTSLTSIKFGGPPAGDWVISVTAHFAEGDATYYFRVHVLGLPETDTVSVAARGEYPARGEQDWLMVLLAAAGGYAGWRLRRIAMAA
jgi:hypothetical protein